MRYIVFTLLFFSVRASSQVEKSSSLSYLEEYTSKFGINFAYNPEMLTTLSLERVNNLRELRTIFSAANVEILEIADDRWLLRERKRESIDQKYYFEGYVKDINGEALINALIYTEDANASALTDETGYYYLALNDPTSLVCCQYLGYGVQCLPASDHLAFELVPLQVKLQDVEIETKKVQCTMKPLDDVQVMRIKESSLNQSALGKDVLKSVQLLGGIDATNDLQSSLSIRSSVGLQSLITLDGIPLYNTEAAFGMFSVLNPYIVSNTVLHKNMTPLEYGEFTGGYLECEGLSKVNEKVKLSVDINTLQTLGSIQIPIGNHTQISAGFRRSNGRISDRQYYSKLVSNRQNIRPLSENFNRPNVVSTTLENQFGDLYFNHSHDDDKNFFSFTLFGSRDDSGTSYDDEYFHNLRNSFLDESFLQDKKKVNLGLSARYARTLKNEAKLMVMFYSSSYQLTDLIISNIKEIKRTGTDIYDYSSRIRNRIQDSNLKLQYQSNEESRWSQKIGVDIRNLGTNFTFASKKGIIRRQNLEVPSVTPYAGIRYNFKEKFVVDFGLRNAIIPIKNPISFASPRSRLLVKLKEGMFLKSSLSFNQQFFRPVELERQLGQATYVNLVTNFNDIPLMRSAQLTLGIDYQKEGFKIDGDLFIRENTGIVEQVLAQPGVRNQSNVFANDNYKLFEGVNKVVGLDVSSSYEKGRYFGLLSYTLSRSQDQFEELFNYAPLPDQNNRLHQFNFFSSYDLKNWTFTNTIIYGSGVYTLNRPDLTSGASRAEIQPSDLLRQLPSYRRWDIGASYELKLKYGSIHFDLGIFNLADYDNVNAELYIYNLEDENNALGASEINLLGRIWTAGVRYKL